MDKIVVYTAIFGGYNELIRPQFENVRLRLFTQTVIYHLLEGGGNSKNRQLATTIPETTDTTKSYHLHLQVTYSIYVIVVPY